MHALGDAGCRPHAPVAIHALPCNGNGGRMQRTKLFSQIKESTRSLNSLLQNLQQSKLLAALIRRSASIDMHTQHIQASHQTLVMLSCWKAAYSTMGALSSSGAYLHASCGRNVCWWRPQSQEDTEYSSRAAAHTLLGGSRSRHSCSPAVASPPSMEKTGWPRPASPTAVQRRIQLLGVEGNHPPA